MSAAVQNRVPVPPHVPPERVVDFDMYNPAGVNEDVQLAWRRLQDGPDIVWTPHYGGYWIATRAEDIETIQKDYTRFSHQAISIPREGAFKLAPLTMDPPESEPYRKLIMPSFLPKAVNVLEQKARSTAIELIEGFYAKGECEFIEDFAKVLPVVVFLSMVDLPIEDRTLIQPWAEMAARGGAEARIAAHNSMLEYLNGWIDRRMAEPGDDVISIVIKADINGRKITRQEIIDVCILLLFGGLDTVASMMGFIARYLAYNSEVRQQIIDRLGEPAFVKHAVEELLRRHGVSNTARVITNDMEFKGVQLKQGEMIQIPNSLVGLDERRVERPLDVDFSRPFPIPHATFGNGVHTCPGAVLARREIQVYLEEWLKRIPNFEVKPNSKIGLATGMVSSVTELHLQWTP